MLTPYLGKITGDHQYGFRHKSSTDFEIFCSRQILEKIGTIMG